MQYDARKVEGALLKKGFRMDNSHHHMFTYHTMDGRRSMARTRTSHGSKTISDPLLAQMARQCRLSKAQFIDLIDCPLSRESYEQILYGQDTPPQNLSTPAE